MKERNDIDDTACDLQSMVDQQLITKNFDANNSNATHLANKYNSSSFMRSEAKAEDGMHPQPPASIPNNEQHEIPTISKRQQPLQKEPVSTSSHNKFLKDTPIDEDMLMKKQGKQSAIENQLENNKDALVKGRPKTSENARTTYDNQAAAESANKFKNNNKLNSKDAKSAADQYDQGTRSNTN